LSARLQLTTTILEHRSCSAEELGLKLRLNIRNVSQQPVILHKQTEIYRIMVSANASGADQKQYEQDLRYDDPGAQIGLKAPAIFDFTVVDPGAAIDVERTVSLYLFNPARPAERFLKPGSHLLQIAVGAWPYIAKPEIYRQQWKEQGYLFSEGLTSLPMAFTVEKDNPVVKCTGGQ
jgi:hypothetical protein